MRPPSEPVHPGSAAELASAVRSGRVSAVELARAALGPDPDGAFLFRDPQAPARAAALDARVARGEDPGPLAGVPIALKANLCVEGWPTDCASRALAGWRAPYTATVVERLARAGAIPIGLTNMDELGMGASTEHSCHGPTRNPRDATRTPGGSSGGSAAAVARGLVPVALGSDTGGSVRQPAALCGVLGFKPTYGRVPRHGLVAFASSLDQVAVLARDGADLALVTSVISGDDPADATCHPRPPVRPSPTLRSVEGLRIGLVEEALGEGVDPDVRERVRRAADRWADAGAEVRSVSLPSLAHALPTYHVLAAAEASSNLARYDGLRYGARGQGADLAETLAAGRAALGPEARRRVLLGAHALSAGERGAWYDRAARVRRRVLDDFELAFTEHELLLSPTAPGPAWPLGERAQDPLAMYAADLCTVPQSLAGLPAASVPCGEVERDGVALPVGLQLTGPAFADEVVLAAARTWEALA